MMQNQATVDAAVAEAYLNAQHAQALAARQRSGGISLDFSLGDGDVHRPHKVRDSLPHIASKHCDGTSAALQVEFVSMTTPGTGKRRRTACTWYQSIAESLFHTSNLGLHHRLFG